MTLADSHCHLDNRQFGADFEGVLQRASLAGVDRMLSIGTGEGPEDLDCALKIASVHENVFASAGIHPHHAAKATESSLSWLRTLAENSRCVAVGEIGLDYHYDFAPRDTQQAVFRKQLQIAKDAGKPVIIHTREAWDDTVGILQNEWSGSGIFHCFTGTLAQALQAVEMGFFLGIGGVLTFPKSDDLREAVRRVPFDRLLLETDAPYLAPAPHRGKRNEPAFTAITAQKLAVVRGCTVEEVAEQTTCNFERLFHLPHTKSNGYTEVSHGTR